MKFSLDFEGDVYEITSERSMNVQGYIGFTPIDRSKPCACERSSQNVTVDRGILFSGMAYGEA